MMKKEQGFSLIVLIVALAILVATIIGLFILSNPPSSSNTANQQETVSQEPIDKDMPIVTEGSDNYIEQKYNLDVEQLEILSRVRD